jgi:hypothetical protein
MKIAALFLFTVLGGLVSSCAAEEGAAISVSSLADLARTSAQSGQSVRMEPGVYRLADYLTEEVLADIRRRVPSGAGRQPVPMLELTGSDNRFDFAGVVFEIDTSLYGRLPRGYTRCLMISGHRNRLDGLTIRNTGPNQGSNGNILSVAGEGSLLENVTLHVYGSFPYGYGDLLGKGGPNLVALQKQSGIQILGTNTVLRRCRVVSRAFGHCFYVQGGNDIRLEDCYAEGEVRATNDMLRETAGPAAGLGFKSVYENRDGRFLITGGYVKSLVEDGFRTYGGAGNVTLINCVAVNTRAGFEIGAPERSEKKAVIENAVALGCERAYLIGSNVIVRRSRGDVAHGPLLYLRGGKNSDVELELGGRGPVSTVHALATIAGENHRVKISAAHPTEPAAALPILLGFGMPAHAEMASPIRPAATKGVRLENEIPSVPVITSGELVDCVVSKGRVIADAAAKISP